MPNESRKHRSTGNPRGGRREGAGRTQGATSALPAGTVSALKAARFRVPQGASEAEAELAGFALQRIVDVVMGKAGKVGDFAVLTAAKHLREEVCGAVVKRHEVTGADGEALKVSISINRTVAPKPDAAPVGGE